MNFDVFLSHNSIDKPAVKTLGLMLQQRGLKVWLDEWQLRPGLPWQDALDVIIRDCKAAMVCLGPQGLGLWEDSELKALIRRLMKEKRAGNAVPVIPVWLPGVVATDTLPSFLDELMWVDLRQGLTAEGLAKLRWGITGEKPAELIAYETGSDGLLQSQNVMLTDRPRENTPTVCIAKVTPDLREARQKVVDYLLSARLNVLPAKSYSADPTKFLKALETDLAIADVFVQILGASYSERTDEFPDGEEIKQFQMAQDAKKVILQWRDKSVDVKAIDDVKHKELVGGTDVVSNDRTEFAKLVVDRAWRVHEVGQEPQAPNEHQWLALVKADTPDNAIADEVTNALTAANVDCLVLGKSMVDCVRERRFHMLMMVCGSCSQEWIDKNSADLAEIAMNFKKDAPILAYYLAADSTRFPYRSKKLISVKKSDPASWKELVAALQQRGDQ